VPADLIPDATGTDAFNAASRAAKRQHAVFVAIERQIVNRRATRHQRSHVIRKPFPTSL